MHPNDPNLIAVESIAREIAEWRVGKSVGYRGRGLTNARAYTSWMRMHTQGSSHEKYQYPNGADEKERREFAGECDVGRSPSVGRRSVHRSIWRCPGYALAVAS